MRRTSSASWIWGVLCVVGLTVADAKLERRFVIGRTAPAIELGAVAPAARIRYDGRRNHRRPPCDSTALIVCLRDTAVARMGPAFSGPIPSRDWVIFGARGDSIDVEVSSGGVITTSLGQDHDANGNTAPFFRGRFRHDGVVALLISLDPYLGDTVEYTLRLLRSASASLTPLTVTGLQATLSITSPTPHDSLSLIPLSAARREVSPADWRIPAGTYRVALVRDSIYQLCRRSCKSVDTIKLTPNTMVIRRF